MATKSFPKLAGILVLFAAVVAGQGGDEQKICELGTTWCYWSFVEKYGVHPLLDKPQEKDSYLANLCYSYPDRFLEDNYCNQTFYGNCTDAELTKFARMERGYGVLREEITSAENCQSVVQLRECMNLTAISTCDPRQGLLGADFQVQVDAHRRGAQILKSCVEDAVKLCDAEKNEAAIAHLQNIVDAVVDLAWGI